METKFLETGNELNDDIEKTIQKNYLKGNIYYQSLNVQAIVQEAKYTDESYFAALGGALSFYIGLAIFIVFELLEFFYDVFINVWRHVNGHKGKPWKCDN